MRVEHQSESARMGGVPASKSLRLRYGDCRTLHLRLRIDAVGSRGCCGHLIADACMQVAAICGLGHPNATAELPDYILALVYAGNRQQLERDADLLGLQLVDDDQVRAPCPHVSTVLRADYVACGGDRVTSDTSGFRCLRHQPSVSGAGESDLQTRCTGQVYRDIATIRVGCSPQPLTGRSWRFSSGAALCSARQT